jgi:hypothetical protein
LKHKPKEQHNPFDDILFWLQLASMDFIFSFEEVINTELNTSISENQSPERQEC